MLLMYGAFCLFTFIAISITAQSHELDVTLLNFVFSIIPVLNFYYLSRAVYIFVMSMKLHRKKQDELE